VIDDRDRDLGTVLSYLVGRPVRTVELAKALGVARSSYYAARDEGRLISADNLLRLADVFELNPVDLLVRYGLVSHDAAMEYARDAGTATTKTATADTAGLRPRLDLPPL
jgi:plasmid maintenance system antidote protein VapI